MPNILNFSDHLPRATAENTTQPQVVVLIHGLFGSGDNLSVIRRHLQDDYRVINIDMPDHGESAWSAAFSFEGYAHKVLNTLKSLAVSKASIVGHSLGGKVAMWMAYLMPSIVDKLIILDIAPVAYEARHQDVISALRAVDLASITSRKTAQTSMTPFIQDAGTQAFLLKSLYEKEGSWHWRFNLDLLERDYSKLIDWTLSDKVVYEKPALFIKGADSDYIMPAHQETIMRQFPKAAAKVVNAGHWLHAQKTHVVNRLITNNLRGD